MKRLELLRKQDKVIVPKVVQRRLIGQRHNKHSEVRILTATEEEASVLGLAAHPDQNPKCVGRAFDLKLTPKFDVEESKK